tara:strand:+ start:6950 stop:7321 length:372 start_codon:yes stop_codon:yes gene_type:complete
MKKCLNCDEEIIGRTDKKFCNQYCKSSYHYKSSQEKEASRFQKIDKILKTNRRILKNYNKSGKSFVRKTDLINEGFNPNYFTNYWKNKKGEVYLFCFEFGFLKAVDNGKEKYLLIKWQTYMEK